MDNIKPVISLVGNSTVTINKGSTYSDAGATVTDNIDTTVTVTTTGSVNPNIVGTYTITYNAIDSSGNAATVTRTVNVIDVKAPVITILGSNPATVSGGGTYSDAGATAVDDVDGDVTSKITTTSTVNTNKLGTYTVTYNISDKAGNTATLSRTVNVVDNILPTVTGVSVPTNWTSGNKTITVTGSDTGLSGIAGYYISTSSTKPTTASAWTTRTSTTWTVSRGSGTYYIWVKDGAGNISSTYKSVNVTNIDANAPTVTAKGSSNTIIFGLNYAISSTYFNISANGTAPISSTICVDTSNGNATVTNASTLAIGTHVIKCTVTKATGLSSNAQTTIVVKPVEYAFSYTGNSQTFTVPISGTYKLEVWGAQGATEYGGKGGYATGTITLNANQILSVHVGGQGGDGFGGYNGGGLGYVCRSYNYSYVACGGGGGGTDIRVGGTALTDRIIVAGGGGGGGFRDHLLEPAYSSIYPGGAGGGATGGVSRGHGGGYYPDTGGTQTSGGVKVKGMSQTAGTLGQGGKPSCSSCPGGGGGYYGGSSGSFQTETGYGERFSGGGGSGYIGGVTSGSMQSGVRTGHGYAKITYIGQ